MKLTQHTGLVALVAACLLAVGACSSSSSGPPKQLSLSGEKVPVSQVTSAYTQMCAIAKQAQSDPAGTVAAFANAEGGLGVLATVLNKDHAQDSQRLLAAMTSFTSDIGKKPPPQSTAADATNVVGTAKQGLQALKITPPDC
jgi:hypothetical protein